MLAFIYYKNDIIIIPESYYYLINLYRRQPKNIPHVMNILNNEKVIIYYNFTLDLLSIIILSL